MVQAAIAVVFPLFGSYFGGLMFHKSELEWYNKLTFPSYRIPNHYYGWVFKMFLCFTGLASYFVWKTGGGFFGDAQVPLFLYTIQVILHWVSLLVLFEKRDLKLVSILIIRYKSIIHNSIPVYLFYHSNTRV